MPVLPERQVTGITIPSQTHLLISSKKIPEKRVPINLHRVPAIKRAMKGILPNLSLKLPM